MSATENELGALHSLLAKALTEKIVSGDATASDISNAIKFLKDNNISCTPGEDNAIGELEAALKRGTAVKPADKDDLQAALENLDFNSNRMN